MLRSFRYLGGVTHPMGSLRIQGGLLWSLGGALRSLLCLGVGTHPMGGRRIRGSR